MLNIASILAVGECMLELNRSAGGGADDLRLAFGGDTLNTAVYLARLLAGRAVSVGYLTALGDDPYSTRMLDGWRAEGIDTAPVRRLPGRLPGLYAIRAGGDGERTFFYWRDQAAARDLFDQAGAEAAAAAIRAADLVYLSGISVSVLRGSGRARLRDAVAAAREGGVRIAFDLNYRPRGWRDAAEARDVLTPMLELTDIALPSFEDMAALFGDPTPEAAVARLRAMGADEVVVTHGAEGCWCGAGDEVRHLPAVAVAKPIDTTAAGDSFNGAYLAARTCGLAPVAAAGFAQTLAARVVRHRGALIPRSAMADISLP